jgi:hypothetical protein
MLMLRLDLEVTLVVVDGAEDCVIYDIWIFIRDTSQGPFTPIVDGVG